jgi:hypothetical protein
MQAILDEYTGKGTAKDRWRWRNPTYPSDRYQKEPERFKKEVAKWQQDNPEKVKGFKTKYKQKNKLQSLLDAARKRARTYGVPCTILVSDIVVPEFCPILGIPLQHNAGKVGDDSPSIDRLIPELGYIPSNIRVISYKANRYKSNLSKELLQRFIDYMDGKI